MTDINLEELTRRLRDYSAVYDDYTEECRQAADAIESLQRELEEARRVAERFAWTVAAEDNAEAVYAMVLNHGPFHIGTIRLEIDAARQQSN